MNSFKALIVMFFDRHGSRLQIGERVSVAESETYAHLEHLRHAGSAQGHRDKRGVLYFETG